MWVVVVVVVQVLLPFGWGWVQWDRLKLNVVKVGEPTAVDRRSQFRRDFLLLDGW